MTQSPRKRAAKKSSKSRGIPAELTDASRGQRLQKVLAQAGVASRREAETLITDGHVTVNGQRVTAMPAWVDPFHDRIEVNGHPIPRPQRPRSERAESSRTRHPRNSRHSPSDRLYIILHKPRRVISTSRDDAGRTSVVDLVNLPEDIARRVFPVGRLDADSTGLILLTNDGELTNRLTHPRYGVPKQYLVSIRGHLVPEDVEKLKKGLFLATPAPLSQSRSKSGRPGEGGPDSSGPGERTPKKDVRVKRAAISEVKFLGHERDEQRGDRTKLMITLREGQNREIRRLMARLGFNVRRLQRVAIGPITIKGLAVGEWRLLTDPEIHKLKAAAGMFA